MRRPVRAAVLLAVALFPAAARGQGLSAETLAAVKPATVFLKSPNGTGSGFVVRVDGTTVYVVTNHHVVTPRGQDESVPGATYRKVDVVFESGTDKERVFRGEVVAADRHDDPTPARAGKQDLAVLKVEGVENPPAPIDLADPPAVVETTTVFASGFPLGNVLAAEGKNPTISVTQGVVSGFGAGEIRITGGVLPGNSGGPVLAADGKLVGVVVSGFKGAGLFMAIPQNEVASLLRGRPGNLRLVPGAGGGDPRLEVAVVDPFKTVKSVTAHVRPASGWATPAAAPGEPTVLPGAKAVPLKRVGDVASAGVKAPAGVRKDVVVQVEMELADGTTVVTPPGVVKPFEERPAESPGGEEPAGGGLRLWEMTQLPPVPADAVSLSDLNGDPARFADKDVKVFALSPLRITPYEGLFDLDVLTDGLNAPSAVQVVAVKDLALQLHDIGLERRISRKGISTIAIRAAGKLKKPAVANGKYRLEVDEVGFLKPDGTPDRAFKAEAAPPAGPPTLAGVNRFPEFFKGKPLTLDACLLNTALAGKEYGLSIGNALDTPPLNLQFYTSEPLFKKVDDDAAKLTHPPAKVYCSVERIDPDTGAGIVGVTKIEVLDDKTMAVVRTFDGKGAAITFPPPPKPKAVPSAAPPKLAPPRADAGKDDKPGTSGVMIGAAVAGAFGLTGAGGAAWWMLRRQAKTGPKYGTARDPKDAEELPDDDEPAPPPPPKARRPAAPPPPAPPKPAAKPAPKPAPKPPADDFPGFDFER